QRDPHVEEVAEQTPRSAQFGGSGRRRPLHLEEAVLLQLGDEGGERLGWERTLEPCFRLLPHRIEGRFAVELLGDELLDFAEAKELAGAAILNDESHRAARLLTADDEIAAEF